MQRDTIPLFVFMTRQFYSLFTDSIKINVFHSCLCLRENVQNESKIFTTMVVF